MDDEVRAPGWDAIDAALGRVYGAVEPQHWGVAVPWNLGGNDPLYGVSAYESPRDGGHFHYVSYGLTDLWDKENDDPKYSGMGFELTFRLAKTGAEAAPLWPVSLMQNLARYVVKSGSVFEPGYHLDANGPICLASDTLLTGLLFTEDPELPTMSTVNGEVAFVQMVGVTGDELACARSSDTTGFLAVLARRSALLVSDLRRTSIMSDPELAEELRALSEAGASTGRLFNPRFAIEAGAGRPRVRLGAKEVPLFRELLRKRLGQGHALLLTGHEWQISFEPGSQGHITLDATTATIALTVGDVERIAEGLEAKRGEYPFDVVTFVVEPSEIRDVEGRVVQTIG
ncbi:MAG: suppressor of fused domain protein [Myxococcales bacterium]|nr:suppressor of fused domain protein [Myxococcales bacterium]